MNNWIEIASKLPLCDAAYLLWLHKFELDRQDVSPHRHPVAEDTAIDLENVRVIVRSAMARVIYDRDHAELGPTFGRMKEAHPTASASDLRTAIRKAVQFWEDCHNHFSYSQDGLVLDAQRAVDRAHLDHPGFSEETRKVAISRLCFEMR